MDRHHELNLALSDNDRSQAVPINESYKHKLKPGNRIATWGRSKGSAHSYSKCQYFALLCILPMVSMNIFVRLMTH